MKTLLPLAVLMTVGMAAVQQPAATAEGLPVAVALDHSHRQVLPPAAERSGEAEGPWAALAFIAPPDADPDDSAKGEATDLPEGTGLFALRDDHIHCFDPRTGVGFDGLAAPKGTVALTAVGKLLYALPVDWAAGRPILILDPTVGRAIGALEFPPSGEAADQERAAIGMTRQGATLWVLLMGGVLYEIDLRRPTEFQRLDRSDRLGQPRGLLALGAELGTLDGHRIYACDPAPDAEGDGDGSGADLRRLVASLYVKPLAAVAARSGIYVACADGAIHELAAAPDVLRWQVLVEVSDPGRQVPDPMAPGEFRMVGREIQWRLRLPVSSRAGAATETTEAPAIVGMDEFVAAGKALADKLRRDERWSDNPQEGAPLMGVVIVGAPDVTANEISDTVDLLRQAGFTRIARAAGTPDLPRRGR